MGRMIALPRSATAIAAGIFIALPGMATAQDSFPVMDWGPMIQTEAMNSAIDSAARAPSAFQAPRTRQDLTVANARSLVYAASPERTRANIAMFAAKSRKVDPKGSAELERLFATQDIMGQVEREMRKMGMTKNNLADAYTAWWTNAWLASQGRDDDLPRAQMQAVKRQAEAVLLATPQVVALNNTQKQEFAEALIVQAMIVADLVAYYRERNMDLRPLKAAVIKGARATNVDLPSMTLTEDGFRTVRGSDASGTTAGPAALAGAQSVNRSAPYVLTAVAGGAGLVGLYFLGKRAGRRG